MKKHTSYILHHTLVIVFVLLLNACSFLEINVENKLPATAVDYTNTADMYSPVVGVYAKLRFPGCHWVNQMLWTGRDEDMTSGRTDDQAEAMLYSYRGGYQNPNSFWGLRNVWVTLYDIIRTSNSALQSLDEYAKNISDHASADYANYLQYQGEIKCMRAWAYFMMVTSFGPCPLLTDNNQEDYTRSTVEHVCDYVIADLESAIPNMQALHPAEMPHPGAFTKYTAEALAARMAMLRGDWQKVQSFTADIIGSGKFTLASSENDDYYNLFKIPGKLCRESLMEAQVTDYGQASGDYIGVDQWFVCQGAASVKNADASIVISGWGFCRYNPDFVAWADGRGEKARREVSFLIGGEKLRNGWKVGLTKKIIFNAKAYIPYEQMTPGNTEYGRNNNVRLLRYAEVLLMNAEASFRLGNTDATFLNKVRERAGLAPVAALTEDIVLDERRMELAGEWGLHYVDLVRTGRAATVLNQESLKRDYAPGQWTQDKAYWPVPGEVLEELPELAKEPK